MQGKINEFNFRQLVGRFLFLTNDDRNLNLLRMSEYPYEPGDNAIVIYGFINPTKGIMFQAIACARLSVERDFLMGNRLRYDIRETKPEVSSQILYEAIQGDLIETDWEPSEYEYRKFKEIADERTAGKVEGVLKIRKETALDPFRHEQYPDDIQVCLSLPGYDPEVLWATAYIAEDGSWNAWLLDNPWNPVFGVKEQESVKIEIRYVEKIGVSLPCALLRIHGH